jgi:hypothetical protein
MPNIERSEERIVVWYRKSVGEAWDFWGYAEDDTEVDWTRQLFTSDPKYKGWQLHVVTTIFPL